MATYGQKAVQYEEDEGHAADGDHLVDFVGFNVVSRPTLVDRQKQLTASQKTRRRHRAWMVLIDKGLQTYREIAEDTGKTVQAIYYGVERARRRERNIKAIGSRHGQ
jgi:hypothetical protein